jgi:hypothetical protein
MSINVCNNNSLSAITSIPDSVSGGALNLISTQTASSSSTISFTSGLDSTYKEFIFKFIDIHPSADAENFTFNMSIDSGSNYNVTKTTTFWQSYHREDGHTDAQVSYSTGRDVAQSTDFCIISRELGNDNDQATSGTLHLFNPSSTTFLKHFISTFENHQSQNYAMIHFTAGYGNTTSAVDAVQFKMSSGTIDSGTVKLYGVS